jgi:hypothetical protein
VSLYLSRRIARAFAQGMATWAEQDVLRRAAAPASVRSFDDLSEEARNILLELEHRPSPWRQQ